ncbi:hypothetical protein CKA56_02770 [Arcobacter venerupis]|nr:hypothetical protein CKA56_02770 [Arcobacter venerupis]
MEWRFSLKMQINKFLKIGLFVVATSLLFTACANKAVVKNNVEKTKVKTINDVLNESFEYDAKQRLYKNKSLKAEDTKNLYSKLDKFCSDNKGKLVNTTYYINKIYVNSYSNNKASVCEINNEPYFITHQASQNANSFYSVSIDEKVKRAYSNSKRHPQFEAETPTIINSQELVKERQEIQKREAAREQKTKLLFNKKDQRTMTFFDSWRYSGKEAVCAKRCTDVNKRTTGYTTIKEATSNNWQLVSKVEDIEEAIDNTCTCSGYSVLLRKLSTESNK